MVDKNDLFGYISAPYLPINAKFGSEMKNHVRHVAKTNFFQTQDDGRLPFSK